MLPAPLKSVVGLIWSFFPVVYCFGLDYYFIHSSGSLQDAENNGLGPTVYGLGIVGLLFCIPLLVKFVLIFIELRKPRLSVGGSSPGGDDDGFDADAVIARYMAQGKLEAVSNSPGDARGPRRIRFGRKNK